MNGGTNTTNKATQRHNEMENENFITIQNTQNANKISQKIKTMGHKDRRFL